ncbi:MAG: hypothetical protein JWM93_1648 [Frankiales bacterium]|nr:hypothetical protein [Frankiales bacterium]
MASRRLSVSLVLAVTVLPLLAACSSKTSGGAGSAGVVVTATDTTCELGTTSVAAGATTFTVTNKGAKTTEVYVYGADGDTFTRIVSEVENIGPGTSREMTATLTDPTYEVSCKPGQTGDGIRSKLTVTGGNVTASAGSVTYDRELELSTDGKVITGLTGTAKTGEKIELKLANKATGARALEVKDPSGAVAGVTESIKAGETGQLIVTFAVAGTWSVIVEGDGLDDVDAPLTVG